MNSVDCVIVNQCGDAIYDDDDDDDVIITSSDLDNDTIDSLVLPIDRHVHYA